MITAQVELLKDILNELKVLFPAHREELALFKDKMPLDPDYDDYLRREAAGQMLVVTLRNDSKIIGYWISFIKPHLHYKSTLTAVMDILYVAPEYREKGAGRTMADKVKLELKNRGVKVWYVGSKLHKDIAAFLQLFGFERIEEYYALWIGE